MASANACWGIDIGAGGIKAIKLVREGDGVRVADFQIVPHRRVLTTPDIDPADVVRLSLGTFMQHIGDELRGSAVVMSVSGHEAFARFAKLPPVDPKGVHNLVKFEAIQQIPFDIEDVEWDYQIFASDDSPELEVGIFAITKDRVSEKLALWNGAGLSPDALTISPIAAFNGISYDLGFTPETPGTIVLDIGATATDLIIAEGGRVWVRTFPLGGHNFTEAIAEAFKLNYAKAEKLKAQAEQTKYKKHVFQALKPILSDLVSEVQRSIQYYQDAHSDAQVERLIGIGSTFKLFGLRKLLSQQLGMEVYRFERFKTVSVEGSGAADFEAAAINLVTAYGLALQGMDMAPISANLVPTSVVRESLWKKKTPWFVAAAGLGLAAAGVMFVGPLLAQSASGQLTDITGVSDVERTASSLTRDWEEAAEETAVTFNPVLADSLLSRRGLIGVINTDIDALVASAVEAAERGDAGDEADADEPSPTRQVMRLDGFELEYLSPGTGFGEDGDGGRRGGGWDDEPEEDEGESAGEFGAIRVTLKLLSQRRDNPYFDRTILQWLRSNRERADMPYTIEAVPLIEDVSTSEARAAGSDASVRRRTTESGGGDGEDGFPDFPRPDEGDDGFGGPDGAPMPGGGRGGRGGPRPMPMPSPSPMPAPVPGGAGGGGMPSPGGEPSPDRPRPRGGGDDPLGDIAPLTLPDEPFDSERPVFAHTLTFVLQLKRNLDDPEANAQDANAADGVDSQDF